MRMPRVPTGVTFAQPAVGDRSKSEPTKGLETLTTRLQEA